jgi:hypothetical protein
MTTGGGAGRLPGLSGVGTTAVVVGGFSGGRPRRRRRDCAASQHRSRAAGRRGGHRSLRTLVDTGGGTRQLAIAVHLPIR